MRTTVKWKPVAAAVGAVLVLLLLWYSMSADDSPPAPPQVVKAAHEEKPFHPKPLDPEESEREFEHVAADNERKTQVLEDLAKQQEDANKALRGVLKSLDDKKREMNDVSQQIVDLQSQRVEFENQVAEKKQELSSLEKDIVRKQQEAAAAAKDVGRRSVAPPKTSKAGQKRAKAKTKKLPSQPAVKIDEKSPDYKAKADASFRKHAFNEYKSSLLPLDRAVPDVRIKECKSLKWDLSIIPKSSIIICFVNEAWSALLRSVWSVINRSPPELIEEILLVDDASDADWLGQHLHDYIAEYWGDLNIRVIRSDERLGLIRARLLGAQQAKGEIMVFLDSHIECNTDWLPPLVEPIARSASTVVTPVIDTIDYHTMNYGRSVVQVPAVGTFSWTMDFTWMGGKIKPGDKNTDPIDSPTMAGGLFAINRKYFYDIGSYDQKMGGWGGENLEMSFRIWQCGGKLLSAPCSHVGHIFRDTHPYKIPGSSIHQTFLENSLRVAEVWMDDYKQHFLNSNPAARKFSAGDTTERKALRERLKCKPFKWFLETLVPDMFIPDKEHIRYQGMLANTDGQCVDKLGHRMGGVAGVYFCHGQGANQQWMYSTNNEVRSVDNLCLDAWAKTLPTDVNLQKCHQGHGNQDWVYDETAKTLKHSASGGCLESFIASNGQKQLKLNACAPNAPSQQWRWKTSL